MFLSVITSETKKAIDLLSEHEFMQPFYLAGGTGCALYIGHRISEDLDFFSQTEFSQFRIQNTLKSYGRFIVDYSDSRTITGRFEQTKISFFHHYPCKLLEETFGFLNLSISSLKDIGCMKIDAISSRGSWRDFVDLYYILKSFGMGLKDFLVIFQKKYGKENINLVHIIKSLVYF
jgi:predicted nucleotidyltransferase component of viral defense system